MIHTDKKTFVNVNTNQKIVSNSCTTFLSPVTRYFLGIFQRVIYSDFKIHFPLSLCTKNHEQIITTINIHPNFASQTQTLHRSTVPLILQTNNSHTTHNLYSLSFPQNSNTSSTWIAYLGKPLRDVEESSSRAHTCPGARAVRRRGRHR